MNTAISPCSLNICPSATRCEMFFLPTELSKDARNEVLSHWMERGNKLQFRLSVFMLNSWFSFVSCQTVQQCFLPIFLWAPVSGHISHVIFLLAILALFKICLGGLAYRTFNCTDKTWDLSSYFYSCRSYIFNELKLILTLSGVRQP